MSCVGLEKISLRRVGGVGGDCVMGEDHIKKLFSNLSSAVRWERDLTCAVQLQRSVQSSVQLIGLECQWKKKQQFVIIRDTQSRLWRLATQEGFLQRLNGYLTTLAEEFWTFFFFFCLANQMTLPGE